MKISVCVIFLLSLISCQGKSSNYPKAIWNTIIDIQETTPSIPNLKYLQKTQDSILSYIAVKASIKNDLVKIRTAQLSTDSLSKIFQKQLLTRLLPHWEGTPWTFSGHTEQPQTGSIACSYFISTTLRDMGLNINRYKLAQQSPYDEARTLALGSRVITIEEENHDSIINLINDTLPDGIHFIGFDANHVGYLLKQNKELYLIHSNYINQQGVMLEPVRSSIVFHYFYRFHLIPISTNHALLKKWLNGSVIEVLGGE